MNTLLTPHHGSRLLAGFGALALLGGIGLASTRPAHTAGGPIAVNVANTPLTTTATDDPAKQPFQVTKLISNNSSSVDFATVPSAKRLVIESATAFSNLFNDTHNHTVSVLFTGSNDAFQEIDLLVNGSPYPAVTEKVLLYAEAGETTEVFVQTSGNSTPAIYVTLTGHYVNVP